MYLFYLNLVFFRLGLVIVCVSNLVVDLILMWCSNGFFGVNIIVVVVIWDIILEDCRCSGVILIW